MDDLTDRLRATGIPACIKHAEECKNPLRANGGSGRSLRTADESAAALLHRLEQAEAALEVLRRRAVYVDVHGFEQCVFCTGDDRDGELRHKGDCPLARHDAGGDE